MTPPLHVRSGNLPGGQSLVVAVLDPDGRLMDGAVASSADGIDELVFAAWSEAVILWGKGNKARAIRVRPALGRPTTRIEFAGLTACGQWDVIDQTNNRAKAAEMFNDIRRRAKKTEET